MEEEVEDDLGCGECSMGETGCGLWDPATTSNTARPVLWSSALGRSGVVSELDLNTRDVVVDERGRTQGWTALRHEVLLSLTTTLGSSAVPTLGVKKPNGKLTDGSLREWEASARRAVQRLVNARRLEIVQCTAERVGPNNPNAARLVFRFKDLRTGRTDELVL